jgi:hypothetical protein
MIKAAKALAKKRTLFAVVLAVTIFGAVYGFAATLGVGSNTLSAGNATVASCQATPVTGTYTTQYDSSIPGYKVASVLVTGLAATCGNKPVSATLTDSSNNAIAGGTLTGSAPAAGGTLTLTPASPVSAATVAGVSVAING